jgi:cytochrome c oxidase assembly factor CtaG
LAVASALMVAALHLTPVTFFSLARLEIAPLVVILVAVAWYGSAVRRVAATGRRWPRSRTASFALAVVIVAVSTLSGLDAFVATSFAVHSVQQMGLFLLAPPFVALSAPVRLLADSGGVSRAERIERVVRSPLAKLIGNPVTAWVLYGTALFVLYFGGQYRLGVEHAWALQLTNLELLAVGCLFAEVVLGADPKPYRLAIGWRVLYLLVATVFYGVLGLAMQSEQTRIAPHITVGNLHSGGGTLWSTAEVFAITATIGVVIQWLLVDEGHARRADRLNAEEDAAQLAAWRAARREAALADVRARDSVVVRSRPAGTDRSERSFGLGTARLRPSPEDTERAETAES